MRGFFPDLPKKGKPETSNPHQVKLDLMFGDCLEFVGDLVSRVDAVVTDAPYGLNYDASKSSQKGIKKFRQIEGDDHPFDVTPFLEFPDILVWCLPQLTVGVPIGEGAWYAWDKVTKNNLKVRISECEYAWHRSATKTRAFRYLWSGAYRLERGRTTLHPNQKPIKLMEWCLSLLGLPEGSTILDPYMGSGSTGLACCRSGFNFIGIEKDPEFYRVACDRLGVKP